MKKQIGNLLKRIGIKQRRSDFEPHVIDEYSIDDKLKQEAEMQSHVVDAFLSLAQKFANMGIPNFVISGSFIKIILDRELLPPDQYEMAYKQYHDAKRKLRK